MLTVVAPQVRVAALWNESGFAVIVCLQSRGPGVSTGRGFKGRERAGRKSAGRKSLPKIVGECGNRSGGDRKPARTARDRGGRDGNALSWKD
jgi:hypothetical protein